MLGSDENAGIHSGWRIYIMHFINTLTPSSIYTYSVFISTKHTLRNIYIFYMNIIYVGVVSTIIRSYQVEMEFESLRDHLMESEHVSLHMWLSPSLDPRLSVPRVSLHDNYLVCNGNSFYMQY